MTISINISGEDAVAVLAEISAFSKPILLGLARYGGDDVGVLQMPVPVEAPADGATPETQAGVTEQPVKRRGRPPKAAEPAPVVEPPKAETPVPAAEAAAQDDAEAAAQDDADEQAESAKLAEAPKTLDDVRAAMTAYKDRYGMAAAQADLKGIWQAAGVVAEKSSDIATPEMCAAACTAILAAVEANPNKREVEIA